MAYGKTNYVNNTTPAINADNLNKSEQGIYDAHDSIDVLHNMIGFSKKYTFTANMGITTSFYMEGGKQYTIRNDTPSGVTAAVCQMFILGYQSETSTTPNPGTSKTVTFTNSGYLRLYGGASGQTQYITLTILGANDLPKMESDISTINSDIATINGHLSDLDDACMEKIPLEDEFVFSGSSGLADVVLTAGVEYTIVNKEQGVSSGLLFIEGHSSPSKSMPSYNNSVKFTPNNTGKLKYYDSNVSSGSTVAFTVIGTDVYDTTPALPEIKTELENIETTLGNMDAPTVYTVGTNKQYTSFVDCINAMSDSGEKVVYVYAGEYDIYEEMGGDNFVASMSTSSSWYEVNPIIPPNTKIIGIGNVLFKYNCPANIDSAKAVLLSCLNMRGTASVENINIECKNLRYAIHIEGSADSSFDYSKYLIKNCKIVRNDGTYENAAIGIGENYGCEVQIDGCYIESKTTHGNSLLIHGNTESLVGSCKLVVNNSQFIDNHIGLQLMCRPNSNANIPVNIQNTYIASVIYKTTGSGQQCNDEFDVKLNCCNNVTVSNGSSISNLKTVNRYNTIGL